MQLVMHWKHSMKKSRANFSRCMTLRQENFPSSRSLIFLKFRRPFKKIGAHQSADSSDRFHDQEFSRGEISTPVNFLNRLVFELLSSFHLSHILRSLALVDPPNFAFVKTRVNCTCFCSWLLCAIRPPFGTTVRTIRCTGRAFVFKRKPALIHDSRPFRGLHQSKIVLAILMLC